MYLNQHEVMALLTVAPRWSPGLRISEALDLTLRGEHPCLIVRDRKGGRTSAVPLKPVLVDDLALYLRCEPRRTDRLWELSRVSVPPGSRACEAQ